MLAADIRQRLVELEHRRNRAMEVGDRSALLEILAEDFVQIHGDGSLDDREGAIAAALAMPRRVVSPRQLEIALLQDTALLTGAVTLAVMIKQRESLIRVFISQLAREESHGWTFFWSQVTIYPNIV
jgi:hypothetical protein